MENKLRDLYAAKGELLTRIELMQNELKRVNDGIIKELQEQKPIIPEVVKEDKK